MNFGSTSTKVAIYEGDKEVMIKVFRHTNEEMANIHNMEENAAFRKGVIMAYLKEQDVDLASLDAIVGRGGANMPVTGGTFEANELLINDNLNAVTGVDHPANLGLPLAQYRLGECYFHGKGTVRDYAQAFYWLKLAAEQDVKEAYPLLAECYEKGLGTTVSPSLAAYWKKQS
jgi:TPR repeat protein